MLGRISSSKRRHRACPRAHSVVRPPAIMAGRAGAKDAWHMMSPSLTAQADENGGSALRNTTGGHSFALGASVVTEGKWTFQWEIQAVGADAAGMFIGVMDANKTWRDVNHGYAWGFYPLTGHCKLDEWKTKSELKRITQPMAGVAAKGCKVQVIVDMDARKLLFAVNGSASVDSEVLLPAGGVRPWVRLFGKGDAVSLSQIKGPS